MARGQAIVGGNARVVSGVATEEPPEPPPPPASTSPVPALVGQTAWRMVAIGAVGAPVPGWWLLDAASYATLHARGWGGNSSLVGYMGGSSGQGGTYNFKSTTASGDAGGVGQPYYLQRVVEGLEAVNANGTPVTYATSNAMTSGIGFYAAKSGQAAGSPPFGGDWANTTNRGNIATYLGNVAGFCNLVGIGQIHLDTLAGASWAVTANRQQPFDFGKALAQAVYAVRPSLDTLVYGWQFPYGFGAEVDFVRNAVPFSDGDAQQDFWMGWLEGMRLSSATGKCYVVDRVWLRPPSAWIANATFAGAYRLAIERALAALSKNLTVGHALARVYASDDLRAYALRTIRMTGMTWRGTDGTAFYDATQPSDAAWGQMRSASRDLGMGPKCWELTLGGTPMDSALYAGANWIAQATAYDDPTSMVSPYPVISSVVQTAQGGGSWLVTCTVQHSQAVTRVEAWLGEIFLKTFTAVDWLDNGGNLTNGYPNATVTQTVTLAGRSGGDVITIAAYSSKDDCQTTTIELVTTPPPPPPPPPPSGTMPSFANTGSRGTNGTVTAAQFLAAGGATSKVVTGPLNIGAEVHGRTFVATDCVFDSQIFYDESFNPGDANLPHWVIDHCTFNGGWVSAGAHRVDANFCLFFGSFWVPCNYCAGEDHSPNQTMRLNPVTVSNSMYYAYLNRATPPSYHTEGLHMTGGNHGCNFTNVRWSHQSDGVLNGNATGSMKTTTSDSSYIDCYWDYDGPGPCSYININLEGSNCTVQGGRAMIGVMPGGGYYMPIVQSPPGGGGSNGYSVPPGLANVRDWFTGNPIG